MSVTVNGTPHEVAEGTRLDRAVALVTSARDGIAVAVNGDVIRRGTWPATVLAHGDVVEVLTAVQGG